MRNHPALALAVAAALAAPALAAADDGASGGEGAWSFTASVWGGRSRYDVMGLRSNVSSIGQTDGRDLLHGSFNTTGAQALLRIGWLDLGALWEGSVPRSGAGSAVVTPLVGVAWNLSQFWRLDLLGEVGGHQISNIGESGSFDVSQVKTVWLPSVGVRPTLSARIPMGFMRAVISLAPFARWDLVRKTVTVDVAGQPNEYRSYDVGGSTVGLVLGAGVEL